MVAIQITEHAYDRGKQRLSLSRKSLERLAQKAFTAGIQHAGTVGRLNAYISEVWSGYGTANNIRIYGQVIYLFSGRKLITLYQIPTDLQHYLTKLKKNAERKK